MVNVVQIDVKRTFRDRGGNRPTLVFKLHELDIKNTYFDQTIEGLIEYL